MAKPWEKYGQQAQAGPWGRYSAPANFSGVSATVNSTEEVLPQDRQRGGAREFAFDPRRDSSLAERAMAGVGKSGIDLVQGLGQQLVSNLLPPQMALDAVRNAFPDSGALNYVASIRPRMQGAVAERRSVEPSFSDDPVFGTGNIAGTLAQIIGPGLLARGTAMAPALLPTSIRGNALQGAVIGAVQPNQGSGEQAINAIGGMLGGTAGAAAPKVAGSALGAMRSMLGGTTLSGAERAAAQQIQRVAANPGALMTPQPSATPGVQRTLAQETTDAGISALERMVRGRNPGAFGPIDAANNEARMRVLQGIAGTEGDMAAAETARASAASAARQDAMQAGPIDISRTLAALDEAIANSEGRTAINPTLVALRNRLMRESETVPGLTVGAPEDRIHVLENTRADIGDMLSGKFSGDSNASLAGSRELIGVRDALNQEIGSQVPRFTDYLNAYRQMSKPINRMEVGRELIDRSTAANSADAVGTPLLQAARFGDAFDDLDAIAARATGFKKAKASDIFTPNDMSELKAIADDMDRIAIASRPTANNSTTDANQYLGAQLTQEAAREAAKQLPFGLGALTYFQNKASIQTQEKLAYLLANPSEARRILAALPSKERASLNKILIQLSARPAAAAPALAQ